MRRTLGTLLLLALSATPALGEVIHLTDGRTLTGRIKRADADRWAVITPDHRTTYVSVHDVASIDVTARGATDPVAVGRRLDALRRAVARVDDPAKALDQYAAFDRTGADAATLAKLQQDLADWRDRADRHLVRLNDRWVHPAARAQAMADALAFAADARQLVKQGRFADADPVLATALSIDPGNVSALYLQGLVRLQQGRLTAARDAFAAVAAALPDHVPARLNLAFVAAQQGRPLDALARLDEAMAIAPADPAVLANVAPALADLPPALARNPVVARVAQRFQSQQQQLANRMAKLGLHPFGAAWLTDAQLADARAAQQRDQARLDALTADFEKAQDRVREIDLAIAEAEVQARRSIIAASTPGPWLASYDGGDSLQLSNVSDDLRNDAGQLRVRRAKAVSQLDDLQRQATAIRHRMTGTATPTLSPVGPEGTPLRIDPQ